MMTNYIDRPTTTKVLCYTKECNGEKMSELYHKGKLYVFTLTQFERTYKNMDLPTFERIQFFTAYYFRVRVSINKLHEFQEVYEPFINAIHTDLEDYGVFDIEVEVPTFMVEGLENDIINKTFNI